MKYKREFDFFIKEIDEKNYEECKKIIAFWLWEWIKDTSNTLVFNEISNQEELEKIFDEINIIPREYYDYMQCPVKEFPSNFNNDVLISLVLAKLHALSAESNRLEESSVSVEEEEVVVPEMTKLENKILSTIPLEKQAAMKEMLICNYMLRCVMEEKALDYVEWRTECRRCFSGVEDILRKINITERNVTERLVERYNDGKNVKNSKNANNDANNAYKAIFSLWQEQNNHYVTHDCFVELKLALMSCIASAPFFCIKGADLKKRTVYEKVPRFFKKYHTVLDALLGKSEETDAYKKLSCYLGELITAETFVFKAAAIITSMAEPSNHEQIIKVFSKLYRLPGVKLRSYYCDRLFELYIDNKRNLSTWKDNADRMIEEVVNEIGMANNILYVLSNGLIEYSMYYSYYISEVLDIEKVPMDSKNGEYVVNYTNQQTKHTITKEELKQKVEHWENKLGIEEYKKPQEIFQKNIKKGRGASLEALFETYESDIKYFPQSYFVIEKTDKGLYEGLLPDKVRWTQEEKWCVAALYAEIKKMLEQESNNGESKYNYNNKQENYNERTALISQFLPDAVVVEKLKESIASALEKPNDHERCRNWVELYEKIVKYSGESLMRYIVWVDSDRIPGVKYKPDTQYFYDFIKKENLRPALQEAFLYIWGMEKKSKTDAKSDIPLYEKLLKYTGELKEAGAFVEKAADFLVDYIPRKNDGFSNLYYWCIPHIYALPGIKLREIVLEKVIDIIKNHERNSMYAYECKAYIEKYLGQIRNVLGTMIDVAESINGDASYDEMLFRGIEEKIDVVIKQGEEKKDNRTPKKEDIVLSLYTQINNSLKKEDISINTFLI